MQDCHRMHEFKPVISFAFVGQDKLDDFEYYDAGCVAVRDFGSMSRKRLGEKYSLAISFTAACRKLLARTGVPEMQLNCADMDANNRPNLTYRGRRFQLF